MIFWGTFFPLISEAVTGTRRRGAALVRPLHGAARARARAAAGVGPVIAWRRATPANLWRTFRLPLGAARGDAGRPARARGRRASRRPRDVLLRRAFVLAAVGQELWVGTRARRAHDRRALPVALAAPGAPQPAALRGLRRPRRHGDPVHRGRRVVGVPGQPRPAPVARTDGRVGGYDITYVRPTTRLEGEKVSLGAVLDVRRDGKPVGTLRPTRGYYPSTDPSAGPVGRYFDGQATSEVGLRAGLRRDLWTAVEPDLQSLAAGDPAGRQALRRRRCRGSQGCPHRRGRRALPHANAAGDLPDRRLASGHVDLVGALVVIGGALIALWPAPVAARRRARAGYAARVARELGRA